MLARRLLAVLLVAAMGAFGYGVYRYIGQLKSSAFSTKAKAPHRTQQFTLVRIEKPEQEPPAGGE